MMTKKQMAEIMPGYDYHKPRAKSKHEESDLHLTFCKWVKKDYPDLMFVRHEKEGKRSKYMQNLVLKYNSLSGLPDFELLADTVLRDRYGDIIGTGYAGLYLEFKRPGRTWTLADGKTLAVGFEAQYACHKHLWSIGRCAYFCNDFEDAKQKLKDYIAGNPQLMQDYAVREKEQIYL